MAQTWGEKGEEREGEDAHGFILSPKMISLWCFLFKGW
jgi:hypothetical protein